MLTLAQARGRTAAMVRRRPRSLLRLPEAVVGYDRYPQHEIRREIMMPEHTSEKAEVKMYSDFKSPYVYLAFGPGWQVGGIIGWDSHDRAL